MIGSTHRTLAAAAALAVAIPAGVGPTHTAVLTGLAVAASSGPASPDADQTWLAWLPGGHRGLTHWPGLPAAAAVYLHVTGGPWWAWGLLLGWTSHLLGDAVYGRTGVPVVPGWRVGVRWDCGADSDAETVGRVLLRVAVAVLAGVYGWGWAGLPDLLPLLLAVIQALIPLT